MPHATVACPGLFSLDVVAVVNNSGSKMGCHTSTRASGNVHCLMCGGSGRWGGVGWWWFHASEGAGPSPQRVVLALQRGGSITP